MAASTNSDFMTQRASSPIRVLVVDDFEPLRRFVCTTLKSRPELQVIGEVSDGLDAVHTAQRLQPDLILLDIGLPGLGGIEVARRIGKLAPECKIIFVSQESSLDVMQQAASTGAAGYVVKTRIASDLVPVVDAVFWGSIS